MALNRKPCLHVVVMGHSNSGKSTIRGRCLLEYGKMSERILAKVKEEAKRMNVSPYLCLIERLKPERENPPSARINIPHYFDTSKYSLNLIQESIGEFIKEDDNSVDAVMFVVSAVKNEFDDTAASGSEPTLYQKVFLAATLGAKQAIVIINKIDAVTPSFSQERYKQLENELSTCFHHAGYAPDMVTCVPISGLTGENVDSRSDKLTWYNGPTLIEAFDNLKYERLKDLPLRFLIQDVYKIGGIGTVVSGNVATGVLTAKDHITIAPVNLTSEAKSLEQFHNPLVEAIPGDTIGVCVKGIAAKALHSGCVIGHTFNEPPSAATDFTAHILILNGSFDVGSTIEVECHYSHVPCKFTELLAKYDHSTGEQMKSPADVTTLSKGDSALVRFVPAKPTVVELFSEYTKLGRLTVRTKSQQIQIVGVIRSVNKKSQE